MVPAMRDVWFIGDDFLRTNFRSFMALETQAILQGRQKRYTFDYYNAVCETSVKNSFNRNAASRVINCLIEMFNTRARLPKTIVVILDADIIENFREYEFGVTYMSGRAIDWMSNEIERLIHIRKQDYLMKKKGALMADEPKVLFIKMLQRPHPTPQILVRGKFNRAMNDTLLYFHNMFIAEVRVNQNNFDRLNNLISSGKVEFWRESDDILREFDRLPGRFKPCNNKKHSPKQQHEEEYGDKDRRFKLPTPPSY